MGPPPIRTRRITLTLPRLGWLLLSLLLLTGGAYLVRMGYIDYVQCRAFASGPTANAVITDCHIDTSYGKKGPHFSVVVTYEYSVNGTAFTGSRLFLERMSTSSLPEAETVMARFPTGASVPVYYDAADPESSVLDTRLTEELLYAPILGAGLISYAAGIFLMTWKHWFYKPGLPINVRRIDSGYVIEPSDLRWSTHGGGVGLIAFFAYLLTGTAGRFSHTIDPSPALILAGCAMGPLTLIGFMVLSMASLRARRGCVVIDLAGNRFQLRSARKHKPPQLDIPISDIVDVGSAFKQQYRSSPDPSGRYAHYKPLIEYLKKGRFHAAKSLDDHQFLRKDTDELCAWLRFVLLQEPHNGHT